MEENWKVWDDEKEYGDVFFRRASGLLPEMESSKAVASHVEKFVKPDDLILDVGCGGGHYLVSLDKKLKVPFRYIGVDDTSYYIEKAKEVFVVGSKTNPLRKSTDFFKEDIYGLNFEDNFADIVMCNNVCLHLPSLHKPLSELWRVTKRVLIVRALFGKSSFRIKQINSPEIYDDSGEPHNYHYFNIYSKDYVSTIIGGFSEVENFSFLEDRDFNPQSLGDSFVKSQPHDLTTVINGMQVNNYIIQPWHFLIVVKSNP